MDKFRLIYRILHFLETASGNDQFNIEAFSEKYFDVSRNDFLNAMEMLIDAGYLKGAELVWSTDWRAVLSVTWPKLTLAGLKYLATDELMVREAKSAKGFNLRSLT